MEHFLASSHIVRMYQSIVTSCTTAEYIFGLQTLAFTSYLVYMYISVDNIEQSITASVSSDSFTNYLFCTHISNKNLNYFL